MRIVRTSRRRGQTVDNQIGRSIARAGRIRESDAGTLDAKLDIFFEPP